MTLLITKKKRKYKRVCVHHGSLEGKICVCQVKALVRQVTHIKVQASDGTTLLCAYWDSVGQGDVTDRDMSCHMKFAAANLGCPSINIPLDRIDTHLNRSGMACTMKMAEFDD